MFLWDSNQAVRRRIDVRVACRQQNNVSLWSKERSDNLFEHVSGIEYVVSPEGQQTCRNDKKERRGRLSHMEMRWRNKERLEGEYTQGSCSAFSCAREEEQSR
jgi:hypothetical protein